MAFVPASGPLIRANTSFHGCSLNTAPNTRVGTVRMAAEEEPSEFGKQGKSPWKESVFTGGMPGGETFYKAWVEEGMTKDFPDLPESLQSRSQFKPKPVEKGGVLGMLEKVEFFKGFTRDPEPEEAPESAEEAETQTEMTTASAEEEPPSEALYAPYFPAEVRNLAPEINITYEKEYSKDRVYLAMTEVTASQSDRFYPKEMKNKAPFIEISYNGNLANASVSVKLDDVEGLPTLPPPPKKGDTVTTLSPGRGGGLKLDYAVAGAGSINI